MKKTLRAIIPQFLINILHTIQAFVFNIAYGFPAGKLSIIGITGTDGKTTTSNMIYHILKRNNYRVGLLSTISAKIGDIEVDTGFHVTSPDPWDVPKYLSQMVNSGIEWLVLEVTSHGLEQNRFAYVTFQKGVFTNITHEHLDYHKTWENYALSKFKLIKKTISNGEVILNKDDEKGFQYISSKISHSQKALRVKEYSTHELSDVSARLNGLKFTYKNIEFTIPILGVYNIQNALAAIKTTEEMVSLKQIQKGLQSFTALEGRMEVIKKSPYTIIVDFAHTPNALKEALRTVNMYKSKEARTIVVFGCAGLRDRQKRTLMGEIAADLADVTILTAEDPRTEKLSAINDQIVEGFRNKHPDVNEINFKEAQECSKFEKNTLYRNDIMGIKSRQEAIALAIKQSRKGDIVIITGKGHEKSLCFGETEFDWSDQEAVRRILKENS